MDQHDFYVRGKDGPVNLATGEPVSVEELMANGGLFVSVRVEDMPEPKVPSIQLECFNCGKAMWCDATTTRTATQLIPYCMQCVSPIMHEQDHEDAGDEPLGWLKHLTRFHNVPVPTSIEEQRVVARLTIEQVTGIHNRIHEQEKEDD